MKVTIEVDVTGCPDCPYVSSHIGHGECWYECTNKSTGRKWYDRILWGCQEKYERVPEWCPIFNKGGADGSD